MSITRRPGSGRPRESSRREDCHIVRNAHVQPTASSAAIQWCHARGNWTKAEWNQVVCNDESRFNLSSNDNRVRVLRPRGERLNPAFALQRRTAPHSWCYGMECHRLQYQVIPSIVTDTHSIRDTMTAQRYVHDIQQPHVLPLMLRLPEAVLQCSASHGNCVTRLSPHCYYHSLACPVPRNISNRAYLGSFWTAS
ncbi:transposable element Tcb1 transposase [Trichonephila clavipes]|uniref:Transposable element Tcb1 transposase n=1 Tax=Trichonephila clavipes TaxID=2585209 RepID=A0A8X6VAG5_TRICX|nr:transposable element Tcb1 transposase [Trichonephila clavipes]